jgi:hypothetical protein
MNASTFVRAAFCALVCISASFAWGPYTHWRFAYQVCQDSRIQTLVSRLGLSVAPKPPSIYNPIEVLSEGWGKEPPADIHHPSWTTFDTWGDFRKVWGDQGVRQISQITFEMLVHLVADACVPVSHSPAGDFFSNTYYEAKLEKDAEFSAFTDGGMAHGYGINQKDYATFEAFYNAYLNVHYQNVKSYTESFERACSVSGYGANIFQYEQAGLQLAREVIYWYLYCWYYQAWENPLKNSVKIRGSDPQFFSGSGVYSIDWGDGQKEILNVATDDVLYHQYQIYTADRRLPIKIQKASIRTYTKLEGYTPTDWSQQRTVVVSETTWTAVGSSYAFVNRGLWTTEWYREPYTPTDWSQWRWASRTIYDWDNYVFKGGIIPAVPQIAINAGGNEFVSSDNIRWLSDRYVTGGKAWTENAVIANTTDDYLYLAERFGAFAYAIPNIAAGNYVIDLKFAENYWDAVGERTFDINIEGKNAIAKYDICAAAGGPYKPTELFLGSSISDGACNIDFLDTGADCPKVCGIAVYKLK